MRKYLVLSLAVVAVLVAAYGTICLVGMSRAERESPLPAAHLSWPSMRFAKWMVTFVYPAKYERWPNLTDVTICWTFPDGKVQLENFVSK